MHPTFKTVITLLLAACILSGCGTVTTTQIDNRPTQPQTAYEDLKTVSAVEDVNFGSQDIVGMTDMMMNDILTDPFWRSGAAPGTDVPSPRIIIDDACFTNESNAEINVKMITDRLGVELNRAATGRLTFLAREFAEMVEKERALKRLGAVSHGTVTGAARPLGADFRLCGNITTLDKTAGDMMSRFTQVAMKMIDLESGVVSWSGLYGFKKVGRKPEDLAVQKAGELRIQAWTDKQFYRVGEKLTVSFKANRDCYLFLYHQGADGAHQLIFPNQFHPDNAVRGLFHYSVPDKDHTFDFTVRRPAGVDHIKVLTTESADESWRWQQRGGLPGGAARKAYSLSFRVSP